MPLPNPYEPGVSATKPVQRAGYAKYLLRGGLLGAMMGCVVGILLLAGVFYFSPSIPGVFELLILFFCIVFFFGLPGVGIGALVGFVFRAANNDGR